jgi:uncharacterized protein with PIN domain
MTPEDLALMHQEMSRTLSAQPKEQVLLWYADLGLEVQGQRVAYRCPTCGKEMRRVMEEFLERTFGAASAVVTLRSAAGPWTSPSAHRSILGGEHGGQSLHPDNG